MSTTDPIVRLPEETTPTLGIVIRAKLREIREPGYCLRVCRTEEFDVSERGISMGRVTIPWHRVLEYHWLATQPFHSETESLPESAEIRIVVEDGTAEGRVHTVAPELFEAGPWTLSMVVDRRLHAEHGLETIERLFYPWHRVRQYERIFIVDAAQTPEESRGISAGLGRDAQVPGTPHASGPLPSRDSRP